ncbi:Putative odorant receptor 13a [Harpegnathos saltator]|uniref:Odorant receptor n=1 Tax=Harpegnathos saltator TaxID=610380 RepID=E2C2H7_HARSA|nr:Putative odorant receptor 13a [Harpegnathos saltator]
MAAERKEHDYASMQMARFLMKTVGFWTSDKKGEERLLKGILGYTLFAIVLALWIESTEFYFSIGDFYAVTYTACSSMPVVIVLMKILFFLTYREEMLTMLRYTQERFWYAQYDDYGRKLMDDINRKGMIIMCTFTFFVQVTVVTYMLTPIIALVHAGICFCCFDNLLGLLGMHTAGQFKLLQHRLETILERIGQAGDLGSLDEKTKRAVHEEIRGCVLQHQELIWYSEKMEGLFMYTTLCQLLVSSVMICVAGFQVFLSRGTLMRRMIFIAHTNGSVGQLFVVTFTAHHLLEESRAVGDSAYSANWEVLSHQDNRSIRNAVLMLMVRSTHACSISAGGFFPVSLETFMAVRSALKDPQTRDSCLNDSDFVPPQVMSTAASYFALLRNFIVDE